jgi:transcription elongation factor Elf1
MICPNCKKEVTPQVTTNQNSQAHSRICPECGKNVEGIWQQDFDQIRVPKKASYIVLAVIGVLAVLVFVVVGQM